MDAAEFDRLLRDASTPEARVAGFAALLARQARTYVEIVGGSAIEIYLSSDRYVSQDVGVVGERRALAATLLGWGFREVTGRSQRTYWFHPKVGLVDLVGPVTRSGLPARRIVTPHGPVMVSAVEPLIVRRLVRSQREHSVAFYRQAVALARLGPLDWGYLEAEARYEQVVPWLERLRRATRVRRRSRTQRRPR